MENKPFDPKAWRAAERAALGLPPEPNPPGRCVTCGMPDWDANGMPCRACGGRVAVAEAIGAAIFG